MRDTTKTAMRAAFDAAAARQCDIYRRVIVSADKRRPAIRCDDESDPVVSGLLSDAGVKRRRQQWSVQRGSRK